MSSEDGAETETTSIDLRQLRHFLGWLFPTALSVAGLLLIVLFYPTYDLIVARRGRSRTQTDAARAPKLPRSHGFLTHRMPVLYVDLLSTEE